MLATAGLAYAAAGSGIGNKFNMMEIFSRQNQNIGNYSSDGDRWTCPKFETSQIRLVLFGDNDVRGRQLLFDSKTIKRLEETKPKSAIRIGRKPPSHKSVPIIDTGQKNVPKFQIEKRASDVKVLEEMMFGSVEMTYRGTTFKVHSIRSPRQLMLTKVFVPEKPKRESTGDLDSGESNSFHSQNSDYTSPKHILTSDRKSSIAQSLPVDVPPVKVNSYLGEDSGLASITSSGSFQTPFASPGNSTGSSYSSLHRRWMRTQTTSLEVGCRKRNSVDALTSQESSISQPKKSKVGLGIIFSLAGDKDEESNSLFENFFFSHITLFEGHISKLGAAVERAYYNKRNFINIILEALSTFQNDVYDLYTAPRLSEPVWLNMMTYSNYRYVMCDRFMKEFMALVTKFDTKNHRFFVSTLITAVLTYHLAWVPTVTPAGGTPSKTYLDKHSAKWLDTLTKNHPYNPLWAQLGDLYGAIGHPLRLSRTIVVGKKADLVNRFLYILSYFIRCSDVHQTKESETFPNHLESLNFDKTPSDTDRTILTEPSPIVEERSSDNSLNMSGSNCSNPSLYRTSSSASSYSNRKILSQKLHIDSNNCNEPQSHHCYGGSIELQTIVPSSKQLKSPIKNDFKENADVQQLIVNCSVSDKSICDIPEENLKCKSADICSMTTSCVQEDVPRESAISIKRSSSLYDSAKNQTSIALDASLKSKSMFTQQLKIEENRKSGDLTPKLEVVDIKKIFIKEGSMSLFDDLYEGNAETKTIDDIHEKDIMLQHPLATSYKSMGGSTNSLKLGLVEDGTCAHCKVRRSLDCGHTDAKCDHCGIDNKTISSHSSVDKSSASRPSLLMGHPGRCRSITPTELSRRRHLSSNSSFDIEMLDPLVSCREVFMPCFNGNASSKSIKSFEKNFGRSLLAGFSEHYLSDFVLHGTSDNQFQSKLLNDLNMTMQHSVLDEPIAEAVCIIADTDKWSVEMFSSKLLDKSATASTPCVASHLVCNVIESILDLGKLKMSPEFCVMHLEDRLQEIYFKSRMFAEYLHGDPKTKNMKELTSMLGFDESDLQLLVAINGTESQNFNLGPIV